MDGQWMDGQTYMYMYMNGQTNKQRDGHTNRQTDRKRDKWTEGHTNISQVPITYMYTSIS